MSDIEIITAGISVKYAVESTAGTRPTSGYTTLPNIKSIPEFNGTPERLEVTDLTDKEWRRYIAGLKDPGGDVGLGYNFTAAFKKAWEDLCTAAKTAKAAGKEIWFEYAIPGNDSFYYSGEPVALGFGGSNVNNVLSGTAHIIPNHIEGFAAASTAGK